MPISQSLLRRLIESKDDSDALLGAYAEYVEDLLSAPLWSLDAPSGSRIPWRLAAEAAKCRDFADAFSSPGIYLFGSSENVPLYLGMTSRSLWKRLSGRYVRGKRSQCQLAVDYESDLIKKGLDGFPKDVREWYRQNYRTSTARLRGAVTFALNGIEGIWFSVIPVSDSDAIRALEMKLIPVANNWNRDHGHPFMLNTQDT